jgi:hypothetical protein
MPNGFGIDTQWLSSIEEAACLDESQKNYVEEARRMLKSQFDRKYQWGSGKQIGRQLAA